MWGRGLQGCALNRIIHNDLGRVEGGPPGGGNPGNPVSYSRACGPEDSGSQVGHARRQETLAHVISIAFLFLRTFRKSQVDLREQIDQLADGMK